jgi:hypothetical protein
VGVARRRARAETVRLRRRSVRRRPASRDRHRRSDRLGRQVGHDRGRRLRGATAAAGAVPDGSDRGRLVGDARPPRLDRGAGGNPGRRGRRRRHDRPEWRARGNGAVRLPGHPPHRGPERLRRPRDASTSAAGTGAAPAGAAAAAGAGCGSARRRAAFCSIAPRAAASAHGGGAGPCGGSIRGDAAGCSPDAGESDDDSSFPWRAGQACPASAISSPWPACSGLALSASRAPDASARTAGAPRRSGRPPSPRSEDARARGRTGAPGAFEAAALDPSRRGRPRARGARRRPLAPSAARCPASVRAGAPP